MKDAVSSTQNVENWVNSKMVESKKICVKILNTVGEKPGTKKSSKFDQCNFFKSEDWVLSIRPGSRKFKKPPKKSI